MRNNLSFPGLVVVMLLVWGTNSQASPPLSSLPNNASGGPPQTGTEGGLHTIEFLIRTGGGAPTPEAVVEFNYSSGATAPLPSLTGYVPNSVQHAMPFRAQGEFLEQLLRYPDTPRARLERWTLLQIEPTLAATLVDRLRGDTFVEAVRDLGPSLRMRPAWGTAIAAGPNTPDGTIVYSPKSIGVQEHRVALNVNAAWNDRGVEGWALVAAIDSGIDTQHPDLRPTVPGSPPIFAGGNFIKGASFDFAERDYNVDERERKRTAPPPAATSVCATQVIDPVVCAPDMSCYVYEPPIGGHGTHVSGVIAAKADSSQDPVAGVCKHCGIQMLKITEFPCSTGPIGLFLEINLAATLQAIAVAGDLGAQVVNISFNLPDSFPPDDCNAGGISSLCDALANARENDVLVTASSGNGRARIRQPASTNSVLAVGGLDQFGTFWDDIVMFGSCQFGTAECGSNWTVPGTAPKQASAVFARNVLSTVYRDVNWNPDLRCGDGIFDASNPPSFPSQNLPGILGDGYGHCTGTSMATPQLAGIAGLVRSVNPLLRIGDPFNAAVPYGVRNVIGDNSSLASWSPALGFGTPDAEYAVLAPLGSVYVAREHYVRNRATPMFTMYSSGVSDYASTPSPQMAMSLYRFTSSYIPTNAPAVSLYTSFPSSIKLPAERFPRANMYVLTTSVRVDPTHPPLVPLYWLDKQILSTPGCRPGFDKNCAVVDRDFMTVASVADLNAALAAGYSYFGRQGYIYEACSGTGCAPSGTEPVYRRCNATLNDCAIFLESEDSTYTAAGYTSVFPTGSSPVIGHAYPPVDTDGDGLIDGMELLIGTSHLHADSDGDGLSDSEEYPLTGVSTSLACEPTSPNAPPPSPAYNCP